MSEIYYHIPLVCKKLLADMISFALRPGWDLEEYDIMIQVWVRTSNDMAAIFTDPEFQELVGGSAPEKTSHISRRVVRRYSLKMPGL